MVKKPKSVDTTATLPIDEVGTKEVGTAKVIIRTGPLSTDGIHVVRGDIVHADFLDGLVYVWSKVIPHWNDTTLWPDTLTPSTNIKLMTDSGDEHEADHLATLIQGPIVLHVVAVK